MKTSSIKLKASRALHKTALKVKAYSPEILAVVGVGSVVTGTVLACKATTKASKIMEETKNNIQIIHDTMDNEMVNVVQEDGTIINEYTEQDKKKDLTIVYAKTGVELVKNYAPSVALIGLGLGALLASNNILRKRYAASAAAYAIVDKSFKDYRGRVVERFGEELDKELRYNIKATEVKETIVDEETGKKKTVKKIVKTADPADIDDFSLIFYEGNPGWDPDPFYTKSFLLKQESYFNDQLRTLGVVWMNDVREALGFRRITAAHNIGWLYDENNPIGDNCIKFGIDDIRDDNKIRFFNGDENAVLLNFNHDGDIYKILREREEMEHAKNRWFGKDN